MTVRLTVIADDLTGALDTGVQFVNSKVSVAVVAGTDYCARGIDLNRTDVVVVNAELRHKSPEQAYKDCTAVVRKAVESGTGTLYIKVDSGLRGNIGAMMQAALDQTGETFAAFAPALPAMNRITRDGLQYIDGCLINDSAFGKDPFEPVTSPYVRDLFRGCRADVRSYPRGKAFDTSDVKTPTIGIFDVETKEDFHAIAQSLQAQNRLRVLGGCAGFAGELLSYLGLDGPPEKLPDLDAPLLVVCGSLNPITKNQLQYAGRNGGVRISLDPEQLTKGYFDTRDGKTFLDSLAKEMAGGLDLFIDTTGTDTGGTPEEIQCMGAVVAKQLGVLVSRLLECPASGRYLPMIIGGDTLLGVMRQLSCHEIHPLGEVVSGTVLFEAAREGGNSRLMLSKSGGFGNRDLFKEIHRNLTGGKSDATVSTRDAAADIQRRNSYGSAENAG